VLNKVQKNPKKFPYNCSVQSRKYTVTFPPQHPPPAETLKEPYIDKFSTSCQGCLN